MRCPLMLVALPLLASSCTPEKNTVASIVATAGDAGSNGLPGSGGRDHATTTGGADSSSAGTAGGDTGPTGAGGPQSSGGTGDGNDTGGDSSHSGANAAGAGDAQTGGSQGTGGRPTGGADGGGAGSTATGGRATGGTATGGRATGGSTGAEAGAAGAPNLTPVSSCAGERDFTPCTVETTPDRKYDICVDGQCVSPGCGDPSCGVPGPHFKLADTGMRTCSGTDSSLATCPAPGDPLYGQDAQYGWDSLHAPDERYTRDLSVASEPVVIDSVTELMWQGCIASLTGSDCATGAVENKNWEDAVAHCDALDWAGYQDWHLPDPYELDSLLLDATSFPAAPHNGVVYWSSSVSAQGSGSAWSSNLSSFDVTYKEPVLCVRGAAGPRPTRFTRDTSTAAEPVVLDHVTGLEWQGCADEQSGSPCYSQYWSEALLRCEESSWAGHTDWRLPNWIELRSITDLRRQAPAIDGDAFPGTPADDFWSSTPASCSTELDGSVNCYADYVEFDTGRVSIKAASAFSAFIRCVRGG
jgi:hypothetical protein